MLLRWEAEACSWQRIALERGEQIRLGDALALRTKEGTRCCLFVDGQASVTVNGLPALPIRVLSDRDELRIDGETVYFSEERRAPLARFSAEEGRLSCGRCKGELKVGDPAVCCPTCRAWHHQSDALPCWTYDLRCSECNQETEAKQWEPAPLAHRGSTREEER